jgi:exopolysaccharide biosynthesis polyprenyl glycosylphosphotransferase
MTSTERYPDVRAVDERAPHLMTAGSPAESQSVTVPPEPGRHSWVLRWGVPPFLVGLDIVAVVVVVVGVEVIGRSTGFDSPSRKTLLFGLILVGLLWLAGLYRSRLSLSVLDEVPPLVGRWLAAVSLAITAQIVWSQALWQDYLVDWRFLAGAVIIGVLVPILRAIGYAVIRRLRARRLVVHRTLVLGAGQVGQHIADILLAHAEYGLHPIGFVDADPPPRAAGGAGLSLLGSPTELAEILRRHQVKNVIIAFSSAKESEMVGIIRTCDRLSCEVFVVPRLFELHQVREDMDNAWGLPLVRLRRATYRSQAWRAKRVFDVLFAGGALLLLAPVMAALALAVRLDGGPGVLFRQERVGVDGRSFHVLKFRSLRPASEQESATLWNVALDNRLSTLGRFLRKTSLDELPQLYNVLRGDMSLVGPRPERRHFVDQFKAAYPSYEARHRVPSGLTGWAQVHGLRGDTSIADRARFDNYYIENWSLWLDVKIIFRTIGLVFRGAGG